MGLKYIYFETTIIKYVLFILFFSFHFLGRSAASRGLFPCFVFGFFAIISKINEKKL